jgi:Ser/Thr protein kinase RdoA (MazF antagonist)
MADSTSTSTPLPAALGEAAGRYLGTVDAVEPVGTARHLLRATSAERDLVIRAWPESTPRERVTLAVEALRLANAAGAPVPEPIALPGEPDDWVLSLEDRLYTAATWLPGHALARYGDFRTPDGAVIDVPLPVSAPADDVLLQAARVIGQVHAATASLVPEGTSASLSRLLRTTDREWTEQRKDIGRAAETFPEIRRWLRSGNRVLPIASEHIRQLGSAGARPVVTHGDLWPANLLVEGAGEERRLTGVVGWSSVRVGSALVDIAHLVTHGSGWSAARAESILGAYTETAAISPIERRLLPVVAALDLVSRVGNLLHLAFIDDRVIGSEALPVLRSGLRALLTSLENLTYGLAPEEEWEKRKAGETRRGRGDGAARKPRGSGTTPRRRSGSGQSRPR